MYSQSVEGLLRLSVKTIQSNLRKKGLSLASLDSVLDEEGKGSIGLECSYLSRSAYGKLSPFLEISVTIRKDWEGLYMEIDYKGAGLSVTRIRLQPKESNLLPGYCRYYLRDPSGLSSSLCEVLYFIPGIGFVPRSQLRSFGILYSQQMKGHKERYLFPTRRTYTEEDLRYRKKHYRGKMTPFWLKYEQSREEEDLRLLTFLVIGGYTPRAIPPELEREIRSNYERRVGKKSPRARYST